MYLNKEEIRKSNSIFSQFKVFFLLLNFSCFGLNAQELNRKNEFLSKSFLKEFVQYVSEDTYVFGGTNAFNLLQSNQFRNLDFGWGYNFGVIGYTPLQKKSYFNIGVQAQYTRFKHSFYNKTEEPQFFKLGVPIYFSYDLPSFPKTQIKLQLGTQIDYILFAAKQSVFSPNEVDFIFDNNQLKRLHLNYRIGLQIELSPFIFETFYVHSLNKMFRNDIGVPNQFCFNIGYFFKRHPLKKSK